MRVNSPSFGDACIMAAGYVWKHAHACMFACPLDNLFALHVYVCLVCAYSAIQHAAQLEMPTLCRAYDTTHAPPHSDAGATPPHARPSLLQMAQTTSMRRGMSALHLCRGICLHLRPLAPDHTASLPSSGPEPPWRRIRMQRASINRRNRSAARLELEPARAEQLLAGRPTHTALGEAIARPPRRLSNPRHMLRVDTDPNRHKVSRRRANSALRSRFPLREQKRWS